MVVVIIGVIGTIAIPRLSRGAAGAEVSALARDLQVLNSAVEHYWAEHSNTYPAAESIERQLTLFSNMTGDRLGEEPDRLAGVICGPYLRELPALPMGPNKGATKIGTTYTDGVGWVYDEKQGTIRANLRSPGGIELDPATGLQILPI